MFVKPGQRQDDRDRPLVVRAPTGRFISVRGEEVPDTQFWHRRMRDGDVVAAEPMLLDQVVIRVIQEGTAIEHSDLSDAPHDQPKPAP